MKAFDGSHALGPTVNSVIEKNIGCTKFHGHDTTPPPPGAHSGCKGLLEEEASLQSVLSGNGWKMLLFNFKSLPLMGMLQEYWDAVLCC